MSEEMLIRHCAPTLAGIKTGNLFSCSCSCQEEVTKSVRRLNRILVPKGLRVLPLLVRDGRALIYVYRPSGLQNDWGDSQARQLLEQHGYSPDRADQCILRLIARLRSQEEFPHEIGLFLSYPPEDVHGFMKNCARGHKCVGYWKVYGDEDKARKTFECYEICTQNYCRLWESGNSPESLTVAG